jgi:hypothetical protein
MAPSPIDRLLTSSFFGRVGLSLILLFVINSLFGLLPLHLFTPAWQLRVAELLRTTAPFTLVGAALIYLCEVPGRGDSPPLIPLRRIQRLAPLAALGFALLIPLQIHASYVQIRNADVEAQKTIRSVERRIASVRAVASTSDLLQLSQGLPPDWQPLPDASLNNNRARLLARVEPELARLRSTASRNKNATIQETLKDGLRDGLLSLIYVFAFLGMRPSRFAPVPLHQLGFHDDEEEHIAPMQPVGPVAPPAAAGSDDPDLGQADRHPWYP